MNEHPIEGLMTTAMNSIQDMIDVNTIIGEPIETSNNVIIIPISKVSFGFAAGGSEFRGETIDEYSKRENEEDIQYRLPFGGGSGAGVSINPIAFLVVQSEGVRLLPVNYSSTVDKLLDYVPEIMEKANSIVMGIVKETKDKDKNTTKIINETIKEATKLKNDKKAKNQNEEDKNTRKIKRTKNSIIKNNNDDISMYNDNDKAETFDFDNYPDDYDD